MGSSVYYLAWAGGSMAFPQGSPGAWEGPCIARLVSAKIFKGRSLNATGLGTETLRRWLCEEGSLFYGGLHLGGPKHPHCPHPGHAAAGPHPWGAWGPEAPS